MQELEKKEEAAILVVDDTPGNLDVLSDLLEAYQVVVSLDGPNALELAEQYHFDLILLDIMMPGMDGFEVCRRLKENAAWYDIPVIFITAVNDTQSLERAFALGGVDYVTKPFRPAELLARVKTHLQLYAMRTRLAAMVEEEIAKRQLQERIMHRQARMAVMGEMLDAVAHQWKQPLNAVALANDLLTMETEKLTTDMITESCDIISKQVEHMRDTLDDFRQFLRPGAAKQCVDTLELIQNVETLMHVPLLGTNVVLLSAEIAPEARICVSSSEFIHVLINLVSNAIDAFKERRNTNAREIRFRQTDGESGTLLAVEDNAGGIPENILPGIFNADVSGKPPGEGIGIGLYMSRRIIEKHGGSIRAENTGAGACFTICMPKS